MTDEQLAIARKYIGYHTEKFGLPSPNVRFEKGYIEDLESSRIASGTVDVVTSNCVINLSPQKERVFSEALRVLKHGGELYFSDIFADRRIPKDLASDPVLLGECLGGAMYIEDFRRLLLRLGIQDFRIVKASPIAINNPELEKKIGMVKFYSLTTRAFKLELEDRCEDYGQVAYYLGSLPENPHSFVLDDHHVFETGKPMPVCSNTASMLSETRYARHFKIFGEGEKHLGLFDCRPKAPISDKSSPSGSCC